MSESLLRKRLKEYGYTLIQVRHFKKHDRIVFGNHNIKISLNLRGKLSFLTLDAVVEACVRPARTSEKDLDFHWKFAPN